MSKHTVVCGEKKSAGGKLVKVCAKLLGDAILGILISGDFFADPGEVFEELAQELANMEVEKSRAIALVTKKIKERNLTFVGISVEDVEEALSRAISQQS